MVLWRSRWSGILLTCVLCIAPVRLLRAAEATRTVRALVMVEGGDGLTEGDVAAVVGALRRAFGADRAIELLSIEQVASELAAAPGAAGAETALRSARDALDDALREYREFDFAGSLKQLLRAREICLSMETVAACREILTTSFLYEAQARLARDGKLGTAGKAAISAAAALDPLRAVPPEEFRPEVLAGFDAAKKAPKTTVPLEAPATGVVIVDGRELVELPVTELALQAGVHYVEILSLGGARTLERVVVPRTETLSLGPAGLDPATLAREVSQALRAGVLPKTAPEAAVVARLARLDRVVLVRSTRESEGSATIRLTGNVLYGADSAGKSATILVASATAAPPRSWLVGLVGLSIAPSAVLPAGDGMGGTTVGTKEPDKKKRRISPWLMLGFGSTAGAAATFVVIVLLLPPQRTEAIYYRATGR